jgi:competence protein ComGC
MSFAMISVFRCLSFLSLILVLLVFSLTLLNTATVPSLVHSNGHGNEHGKRCSNPRVRKSW